MHAQMTLFLSIVGGLAAFIFPSSLAHNQTFPNDA